MEPIRVTVEHAGSNSLLGSIARFANDNYMRIEDAFSNYRWIIFVTGYSSPALNLTVNEGEREMYLASELHVLTEKRINAKIVSENGVLYSMDPDSFYK